MLPSLASSLPPPAGAARSSAASTSVPTSSFAAFMLERISKNPFMIGETLRSLRPPPPPPPPQQQQPLPTAVMRISPAPHSDSTLGDTTEDLASIPSTLDAAQRAVIAQASASGSAAMSNPASALAVTAVLQRALVDAPLLPFGGCHLLHELIWSPFVAGAAAAKEVGCYRKALQLYDARQTLSSGESNGLPQEKQAHSTEEAPSTSDGESNKARSCAAANILTDSPLASSSSSGPVHSSQTPEELSLTCTRDTLAARMEQASVRLAESRRELQRGIEKMRRLVDGLRAYDVVPLAELARQQQEASRLLFTPVVMRKTLDDSAMKDNHGGSSSNTLLGVNAASAASGCGGDPVEITTERRKRSREA